MPVWCETVFQTTIDAFVTFVSESEHTNANDANNANDTHNANDATSDATAATKAAAAAIGAPTDATNDANDAIVAATATTRPSIDEWHHAMSIPIPDTVKYAKAIRRINNSHPPIYAAVEYNDTLTTGIAFTAMSLQVAERAYTINTDPEWRDEFWLLVRTLNGMAASARGYKLPNVPTRTEIRENIDEHRRVGAQVPQPPQQAVTVAGAFEVAMKTFAKELGSERLIAHIATEAAAHTTAAWSSMLSPAFEDASTDNNRQFMTTFKWPALPIDVADDVRASFAGEGDPQLFVHLNQMNGFARVAKHIPTNVMDQIEGYTAKLLMDVKSGAVNIRNLDLEKIGSAVLSKVSASDMSALSANLEGLLPILDNTSFKR